MIWLWHQNCLLASETESGLIWYCSWAEASDSKVAEARAVAVNVFIMPDYWRCVVCCVCKMVMLANARLISSDVSVCSVVEGFPMARDAGMPTAQWGRFTAGFH